MHLEYNALGQPCGKWRRQYGKQIGLSIRKIFILHAWNEVPEGLKNSLWNDTMVSNFSILFITFILKLIELTLITNYNFLLQNLFHIEHDEEKKSIFLSVVAERFRDFKSKLVARWITKKSHRQTKKVKTGNEGGEEAPSKMSYEIWPNISKNEWEAFVAKKTTPNEVVSIPCYNFSF